MILAVKRTWRERIGFFSFIFVLAAGATGLFAAARMPTLLREAPELIVIGAVVIGLCAAWSADRFAGASVQALRIARLGRKEDQLALLAGDPDSNLSPGHALLAIEVGDLGRAGRILDAWKAHKQLTEQESLARVRYKIANAAPEKRAALVDELLSWHSSTGGVHGLELERYRAFVLAKTLVETPHSTKAQAIAKKLFESRDDQVRGYAAWLALAAEAFEGKAAELASAFPLGAALARHHGNDELARNLDVRASKLLADAGSIPYRA